MIDWLFFSVSTCFKHFDHCLPLLNRFERFLTNFDGFGLIDRWWMMEKSTESTESTEWDILMKHFDKTFYETFWQDIFTTHFDNTYWWPLKNFDDLWYNVDDGNGMA